MASPVRERRRLAPEARRAQILDGAFRCFAARGFHAARMDDLARECGLSKGSLYWHFDSKEDVFLALFEALEAEIFAAWEDEAAQADSALRLLRREGEIALNRLAGQRVLMSAWMEFLAHPAARTRMRITYERSRARLAELIERGIAAGEIRAELCVADAAVLLTGAVEGLVLQTYVDSEVDALASWNGAWPVLEKGLAR